MKKFFKTVKEKLLLLAKGSLLGLSICVAPVALVHHRQLNLLFQNTPWSLKGFFALCLVSSIIFCFCVLTLPINNSLLALIVSYLFCYTACCALCQKFGLTLIFAETNNQINKGSHTLAVPVIYFGWFLISLSALIQLIIIGQKAQNNYKKAKNKEKLITTPDIAASKRLFRLSWLFFMTGIPLSFDVWLPLIAIPGIWVAMKWLD